MLSLVKVRKDFDVKKISIMGRGKILGLEDVARMIPYSYSIECVSQTGLLLAIEARTFQNQVKHFHNGFEKINELN